MDDAHSVLDRRRRAGRRRHDRRGRRGPVRARRRPGGRRVGRHRDARHDRHPPAHVADRDARLRRRLDPDAVLRLVLPRARQALPARGHPRRQRAVGLGVARGGRHHHGRLVARPADAPTTPTRRPTRWSPCPGGSCWRTATSRPRPGSGRPTRRCAASSSGVPRSDLLGFQLAFDVTGDPAFPEQAAYEFARDLGLAVTTHAGVWGATNDDGIRLAHDAGLIQPDDVFVHAATLDSRQLSPHRGRRAAPSRCRPSRSRAPGQGYPPTWQVRRHGIPVSLSMDTSVWWSGDLFTAMRTTLGADRSREHLEAHVEGDTVTHSHLRAEHVVDWATRGGARGARSRRPRPARRRQEGRRRADQERPLAGVVPAAEPLRPRGLPGAARRRAHRRRRRPRRQARGPAGRRRPAGDPHRGREHRRPPRGDHGRGGLGGRHEPRPAHRRRARQPLPVHRLQVRRHPRGARDDVRRPVELGGRSRARPGLRRGARARARRGARPRRPARCPSPRSRRPPTSPGRPRGGCC